MAQAVAEEVSFSGRVIGAALSGAAGALVAATLSSVTEPIVNRVLVKRMSLTDAITEVDLATMSKFFETTVTTNFIKFPFFEVVGVIVNGVNIPPSARGAVLGAVFTTVTLPITNYRYCKSMGLPVEIRSLYTAYLPTVLRDVVYGICRNEVSGAVMRAYPDLNKTAGGQFALMFITVLSACIISAPGNELRGYFLQPKDKKLPVKDFFKPDRFVRSTAIGGLIMSTALGVGTLVTGPATEQFNQFRAYLDCNPLAKIALAIFLVQQYYASKQHKQLLEKISKSKEE